MNYILKIYIYIKAILDDRIVDIPLHPLFWKLILDRVKLIILLIITIDIKLYLLNIILILIFFI
jgi:hypothetical protein